MNKISLYFVVFYVLFSTSIQATTEEEQANRRIVNGEAIQELDYPWMVELRENNGSTFSRICGASIIHSSWVLTAAHCVFNTETNTTNPIESYEIRIGNLNLGETGGRIVKLKQIILPETPNYNPNTLENDIALIELAESVTQTPITLLDKTASPIPAGMQALLTGWGRLAEGLPAYIQHVYAGDARLANLPEPTINEDEDPLTTIINTLSGTLSDEELIKVILAAPQIGLKERYDTVLTFLNKVIFEGNDAFNALASSLKLNPETARFNDVMQMIKTNNMSVLNVARFIDQVYSYEEGQLQKLYYPIVPTVECEASGMFAPDESGNTAQSTDGFICAGFAQGGKSNCSGDSGGPLSVWNGTLGQWTQVGLVSFSSLCSARHLYDVYTRVSHYSDFIKKHVPEAQFVTLDYQAMQKCDEKLTPVPFAPRFGVNQQQKYVKLYWEHSSYVQDYILTVAPYSNPLNKATLNNVLTLPLAKDIQHIDVVLPEGSDYYVTLQAKNCAGLSKYASIHRAKLPLSK